MKALLAGIALLALAGSGAVAAEDLIDESCAAVSSLAATIATAHQEQVPLAELLAASGTDPTAHAIARKLALKIYAEPRFSGKEYQQRFINKWRDGVHLGCLLSKESQTAANGDPS